MAATLFKERTPREMQTPGRVADSALNKYFSRKRTPFSPIEYHSRSNYHKYSSKHAGIAKIHQLQHSELGCRIQNKLIDSNTTAQQHGFGLLIWNKSQNSQRNDNDSDEKSLHLQSCDMNSKHCSNYAKKREDSTQVIKKKAPYSISNPSLILLVATIVCIHHASFCTSFSDFERNLDTGLSQLDHPFAPPIQRSYLTSQNHGTRPNWLRQSRSFPSQPEFDEPLPGIMSSTARSFSQDESASTPPLPANSWTSIFTNPFGTNSNSNNISGDTLDQHIKAILVPRVSGTQGNTQVRQYIADNLRKNDYRVEFDEFTASTPIGATDSAVPCAMLLRISETFDKSKFPSDLGLRFIFFDGEEAFDQWTSTDSLYGSRHLAAKWEKQQIPAQCKTKGQNELERIELFVLLDLIGTADTTFVMYNKRLKNHYEALQSYEKAHMLRNGHTQLQARLNMAFKGRQMSMTFVEDDHVPFKKRGVPILLLLAHPFPSVWHTTDDDYSRIDFPKTRRILYALEQFVSNYSKDKV